MKFEKFPFNHIVIDHFLTEDEYNKISKIYNGMKFEEKRSDLFHFYQTKELNKMKSLNFFSKKIQQHIEILESNNQTAKNDSMTWFNIFASFYREGSYLLCHDDKLDQRKYAFSYYLEDFESGDLILFNKTADREVSRLRVKGNRIVIFEVGDFSFHEVAICSSEGRKAFTGWLNTEVMVQTPVLQLHSEKLHSDLESAIFFEKIVNDCMLMEITGYNFNYDEKKFVGPFTERRVNILQSNNLIIPLIKDHSLLEANYYQFDRGNYILFKQMKENQDIWDIFVMFSHDTRIFNQDFITYIQEDGTQSFDLTFENNSLYAVRRRDLSFFIPRTKYQFLLAHFVIKKNGG